MAPKHGRKKQPNGSTPKANSVTMGKAPSPKASELEKPERPPLVTQPTDGYAESQEEEREVLKAIYMDDYEEVEAKGAWSVCILSFCRVVVSLISSPLNFIVTEYRDKQLADIS